MKKIPSGKRKDSQALKNAKAAVDLWYERRLYLGKVRIRPKGESKRASPDVPDEFLRSESFIGPSTARPDGVTAWGVETVPSKRDRYPWGIYTSLAAVSRDETDAMRSNARVKSETLAITERAMLRLGLIEVRYWVALEMSAAGYSLDNIAATFKVAKYIAKMYVECGLTWIAGCLIVKPDFKAVEAPARRMEWGDLFGGRRKVALRKVRVAVWGDLEQAVYRDAAEKSAGG